MNLMSGLVPDAINPLAFRNLAEENVRTDVDKLITVERGFPNAFVDFIRKTISLPHQLVFGNMKLNAGPSQGTIDEAKQFLRKNHLYDVAISANQYKPQEVWRRIFTNKNTSILSKCTLGIAEGLCYTVSVSRLLGITGDYYSPSANMVHLLSDDPKEAVFVCASALEYHSKKNPSLYAISLCSVPRIVSGNPALRTIITYGLRLGRLHEAWRYFYRDGRFDESGAVLSSRLIAVILDIMAVHPMQLLIEGNYKKLGKVILISNLALQTFAFIGQCMTSDREISYTALCRQKIQSVAVGIGSGVLNFIQGSISMIVFTSFFKKLGIEHIGKDVRASAEYERLAASSCFFSVLAGPFVEELVFRVILQDVAKRILEKILPDREVKVPFNRMKLVDFASIAIASLIFGLAHLHNKTGLVQPMTCILSGCFYGVLYQKYGFLANFCAHAINNAVRVLISRSTSE